MLDEPWQTGLRGKASASRNIFSILRPFANSSTNLSNYRIVRIECNLDPRDYRTWYDAAGRFSIVGKFDGYEQNQVALLTIDEADVSIGMVQAGFAWHYAQFSDNDPVLAASEEFAKRNRRGLWSAPTPTAPWEFRRPR